MKERLDILLVEKGFFDTREKAKRAIMAGNVIVNEKKIDKAGTLIKTDEEPVIRVKGDNCKYVSRGGLKLEKALTAFNMDFTDKVVLDIGASTGGFTDCALQNGAKFVYSVDVGTNQLDWKLRNDPRVKSLENKHIKDLTSEDLDNSKIDIMVMDVSFISITKVFEHLKKFFNEDTKLMALIKPQFEVGKENIEKGGIVRDSKKHLMAIEMVVESAKQHNLQLKALDFSPITGTKGNVEYISIFTLGDKESSVNIEHVVNQGKNLGGAV
ncbi:MAG: TlyA family RNA methyltransferase [Cetobacterium sp.]|uniref:TlyA family RNA methyltransferase n=1 Tax=unclassified Cetobacterium TaxID=2630983 RepID=UPI00163D1244|nr:TlyA family RNA methyltransferase [Cetobacterium sp. 2A]MBC2856081.1 TlyA family RNA methyltransferase [Cetobacterium sp. 2A]